MAQTPIPLAPGNVIQARRGDILTSTVEARRLLQPGLSAQTRTELKLQEALENTSAVEQLPTLFTQAVEDRRQELVAKRQAS